MQIYQIYFLQGNYLLDIQYLMMNVNNNNLQNECLDLSEFMKYNFNVKDAPIKIEWMCGAQTNICYNALGKFKNKNKEKTSWIYST